MLLTSEPAFYDEAADGNQYYPTIGSRVLPRLALLLLQADQNAKPNEYCEPARTKCALPLRGTPGAATVQVGSRRRRTKSEE